MTEAEAFQGKVLLITGGTGSFGNAVLDRFLNLDLSEIRIFSRDEKKQDDMRHQYSNPVLRWYIGDVRNYDSVRGAMAGVDYVFHAAALKQVPSCEFYPMEAVRTNVLGTENVLNAAVAARVQRVVALSTDKAAYPINAMGMSKALMEKLVAAKAQAAAREGTVLSTTRYGNVMASRGSVIPLFIGQLLDGQPLTLTDPAMTRFMMTIEDAVDLVVYAFGNGAPGDLFVKKAPAASLQILISALGRVFNREPTIKIIGTRHGEKLYETLLTREEMSHAEDCGEYFRVGADVRDLNYGLFFTDGEPRISRAEDYHSHNARQLEEAELGSILRTLPIVTEALVGGAA